jgi:hypothetical protein
VIIDNTIKYKANFNYENAKKYTKTAINSESALSNNKDDYAEASDTVNDFGDIVFSNSGKWSLGEGKNVYGMQLKTDGQPATSAANATKIVAVFNETSPIIIDNNTVGIKIQIKYKATPNKPFGGISLWLDDFDELNIGTAPFTPEFTTKQ